MANKLETHVRKLAMELHSAQIARLYKIPNDIKIVEGRVIHAEQTTKSLPIGPRGLKAHQQIAINEAHKSGGIGILAWQHGLRVAVIDAGQVNVYRKGRKSIAWKDIPEKFKHGLGESVEQFFWPFI